MQPSKFVVKCRNFAVLVDLHVLPLPGQNGSTWFSQEHKEEVSTLVKDAVEQRVRQFLEGHSKQRKELSPHNPLCIKGRTLLLAAYFMKRHVNLRCIIRQHCRKLRVFPERFVVCVSLPDDDRAPTGNMKLDMTEQSGQSRSGYFSSPRETLDPLNSSTITKRATLQKIARQVDAYPPAEPEHAINNQDQNQGGTLTQPSIDGVHVALVQEATAQNELKDMSMQRDYAANKVISTDNHTEKIDHDCQVEYFPEQNDGDHASESVLQNQETTRRRRRNPSSPSHQKAKRVCLREPFIATGTHSGSTMASSRSSTLGPFPNHPSTVAQAPSERMLEEVLLTHGKQALHLPLSNSPAKHTNQSRLAASLRGLSVKAVSSSSCISSRLAAEEKRSVPRISRLRRLKKS
ncbi:protein SLX4IP [Salminus brasiliensis]|uniref:protein SLX4IP n=1 Tax=Salminus brasiliensis TaxID=930266 RepID=UPI003B832718